MALNRQRYTDGKKTDTKSTKQNVTVGGRNVTVDKPKTTTTTTKQSVSVGGRDIKVDVPKTQTRQPTSTKRTNSPSTSNVTVGGRTLSNQQKNSSITQPYVNNQTAPQQQTRSSFSNDRDYENYIVGNKVDFTKGEARDYIQQKSKEQDIHPMKYMEGMRNRYKNMSETQQAEEKYNNGTLSESAVNEINNRFGTLLDENGNEVDATKYQNDVELVNKTAEDINKEMEKLNKSYTDGKIDYDTYQNQYNAYKQRFDENSAYGQKLNNYRAVSGFDYYNWAKDNGKDVSDFEAYVENVNDTMPERLAQEWASSWADTLKIVPQTLDVLAKVYDPEHEDSNVTKTLSETSAQLREYAFAGANQFQTWNLQAIGSLMPMINSMMIGSLFPVNTEVFTNVSLGISSGAETARRRLEEGCDTTTAVINGALHGAITGLVEGFNAGAISELVTGSPQKWLMSIGLMAKASPTAILGMLNSIGMSEATEEGVEAVADVIADNLQNFFLGDAVGRVNADTINPSELVNEMAMAYMGTLFLGAGSTANVIINTKRKYNSAMAIKAHCESVLASPISMEEEKAVARRLIEEIDYGTQPFRENSTTASAVDLPSDMVEPMPSYDELMNNLANAMQPDVQQELATAQQTLEYAENLRTELQNSLVERGMNIDVDSFLNMDAQNRAKFMNIANRLSESGVNNAFTELLPGQNGMSLDDGVVINTDQSRTLNVDALADLDDKTANEAIRTGGNEIFEEAGSDASAESAAAHEITHFAERSGKWNSLRDTVEGMMGTERFNKAKERLEQIYKSRGVSDVNAEHELVAFYLQNNFGNQQFLNRLASYNSNIFNRLFNNVRSFFSSDTQTRLEQNFMSAIYDAQSKMETQGTPSYSIGTVFQAVNLDLVKVGDRVEAYVGGEKVDNVTLNDVKNSSLGNLMNMTVRKGFLTKKQANDQMQMYADMCNLILRTSDPDLVWAISGSLGYQRAPQGEITETGNTKSSAFTTNSDKQYSRTFDVTTICNKTQQVINVMSETMMKLGRGLTENEIVNVVYDEVNKAGEPVPCPVCYVFSRWVGVGGLLDNIKNYQIEYANADINELQRRYDALSKQVDAIAKKNGIRGTDAREIVDQQLQDEFNELTSKENLSKLTGKKMSKEDVQRMADLKEDLAIMNRWSWIGKVRLNENYKPVPDDVLFDMNKGEEFANDYPETWTYRTTRGPAMGKAITPYTSEVLGQTIMGFSGGNQSMKKLGEKRSSKNNPFLKENETKQGINYFSRAVKNAKAQNLIGGSRAQSTSDFRFEYVLDYLLHFMELQSIGSYGQTYTKVPEAVPLLASVGYETNMSLMAKGYGFKEADANSEGAIQCTWDSDVLEKGKWYSLEFSDVTGMNANYAFKLASMYDTAQPIIVGINDDHMKLCMADPRITFIIPYHASGASEQRYLDLMRAVGEEVPGNARKDYSKVQTDALIENPTSSQKALRKARLDIIMGKANAKTKAQIEGNEILSRLYERFYVDKKSDCYHNFLKKDQAEIIFPYEYWDETSTIENADVNGERFVKYCEDLGMVPRFSEFKNESGYWKTLIDRPMYNVDGSYHYQRAINLDNFNTDYLFRNKVIEGIIQPEFNEKFEPTKMFNNEKTAGITNKVLNRIDNAQYSIGFNGSDDVDSDNYPIPEKLAKMMKGTKLTNGKGQLLRIYHTSGNLFSEFDPRDADHYRFGDQVVNYFSTSSDVSGSYADGNYNSVIGENSYNAVEKQKNQIKDYYDEYIRISEKRANLQEEIDDSLEGFLSRDDVREALITVRNNLAFTDLNTGSEATSEDEFLADELLTDLRQIIEGGFSPNLRFTRLLSLNRLFTEGKYETDWGVEYVPSNTLSDLISPLKAVLDEAFEVATNGEEKKQQIHKLSDDEYNAFSMWQNAVDSFPSVQYVGYGKSLNPYILQGQRDINGIQTNWNEINSSDYTFNESELDIDDIFNALLEMSNNYGTVPKHKQGRAEKILELVNKKNMDYLIENPIFLANLSVVYANELYDLKDVGEVAEVLEENLEKEMGGEEFSERFDEVYDLAKELAEARGFVPYSYASSEFEDVDWDEAVRQLGIESDNKFKNKLETNDVVKAVLAINNFIKNNDLEYKPYDGVVFKSITDSGNGNAWNIPSDIIALFNSNQFKLATNKNPTESPDIRYSLGEVAKTNDSGDVVPPTRVNGEVVDGYGEQRTQRFASSNIPKSQIFNEEQQEQVREEVAEGKFTYNSLSNKVEVQRAREWMERDGIDATYEKFMSNNSPTVKSAVQGEVLLQELAKNNDPRWHDVAVKMADDGTVLGQALQAYSIMQRLTPEGQLVAVRRNMERLQRQLENMYGKDAPQLELKPELEEELRTAKTPEEAENARDRIQKDLIGQMPITLSSMIDAWRYLAMLGNPRTHVRNILGNAMFIPAIELKNAIGTVLENTGIEKVFGKKLDYRTKAILTNSKADKALIDFGKKEYQVYKGLIEKQQKYERKSFSEKTVVGKALNKASDFNSKLLDKEDFIFSEDRYARSFAQFLKANNLTEENITGDMRQRANAYALLEAEKATYRDANDIADWFNELEHSDKKGFRMASYVKKAVLPFTKTPMNIIKRGLRYSPAGLVETITYGAYELSKGKVTANQWIDNMASGMSGTMIALLGMLLTSMGLFRTKDDDSTRKNYYDSENGEQDYAVDLSPLGIEGTYTVDWMSPVIMPFAMGSELYSAFSELTGIDGVESVAGLVADTVSNLMDPIVETSMLSSLKDTMKSYSTSGGEYFGQVLLAVASNYIQQMFPTIGGQIARTIDDTRRTTYPNKGFFDKTWRQIRNKIPGLSKLNEPYINKEGKAEKTEDLGMGAFGRLVLNTLSPGYYSSKDIDEYDEEMYRLFSETGEESVLPSATSSSLTYEKENYKFTPEQYTQWHQVRYETESKYVNSFIDSEVYKNLSDEERIATIKDIRSYAQKVAKKDFLDSLGIDYEDKQLKQADGALDNGIELYSFYDYLNNAGTKQAEKVQYLEQSGLSKQQKDYLWNLSDYKASYEDVYKKVFDKSSDSSSSKKKSSTSKKKSSNKVTGGSAGRTTKAKSGGKISPLSMATPATRDTNIANNFFRAYSNTFNRGRGTTSTHSGNTIVCPRCGNRVSSGTNVCPICGNRL